MLRVTVDARWSAVSSWTLKEIWVILITNSRAGDEPLHYWIQAKSGCAVTPCAESPRVRVN